MFTSDLINLPQSQQDKKIHEHQIVAASTSYVGRCSSTGRVVFVTRQRVIAFILRRIALDDIELVLVLCRALIKTSFVSSVSALLQRYMHATQVCA